MKETVFSGSLEEYFKTWITNLFLTIITLGIYSPWAGVINKKYIYQNINIDGHRFDYIAKPIQILVGRIIALVLLSIVLGLSVLYPLMYNISMGLLFFLSPWIINRSMSFQLRMTTYRGVSFDFDGEYIKTFLYFIILPIASIFTLFLALPYIQKIGSEYVVNKTKYGNKSFKCSLSASEFYKATLLVAAAILAIIFIAIIFTLLLPALVVLMIPLAYLGIIAASSSIWTTVIRNHSFNNTALDDIANFKSNMEIFKYMSIQFTNILMLAFSLGLAYPVVVIRNTQYLASTLSTEVTGNMDVIIDDLSKNKSAVMDEVAGAFDLDI